MGTSPESQLIRRAAEGSSAALNAVFERYGERLLALIRLRLGPRLRNQVGSQDVLQQTLLKAFRRIEQFEGSGETSLMGWLGAIARNEIRDQAKYLGREARDVNRNVPLEEERHVWARQVRTQSSRLALKEQSRLLEQALESLSEAHREVILLRRYEELTYPEIGERMGKSPDACRVVHVRAMAALTVKMKEMSGAVG